MSDNSQPSVVLPEIVWIGSHPTISHQQGTTLRRCVRCNARRHFDALRCEPGLIVHLIDPGDVAAAPAAFKDVSWAQPDAIAGAHAYWTDRGFRVVPKPDGPLGEDLHPRFRPCPYCNAEAMAEGRLGPVHL